MTPEERASRARMGAYAMHSKYDSTEVSQPGRDAFMRRFEDEVDPERQLSEAERLRRAEYARKAYFTKLARASAKARRSRVEERKQPRRQWVTPVKTLVRELDITYRQLDYWMRRMGVTGMGPGVPRELTADVVHDLTVLVQAKRDYDATVAAVLARWSPRPH